MAVFDKVEIITRLSLSTCRLGFGKPLNQMMLLTQEGKRDLYQIVSFAFCIKTTCQEDIARDDTRNCIHVDLRMVMQ